MSDAISWWPPREVVPTVEQLVTFVLPHLDELRNNEWPVQHTGDGIPSDGRVPRVSNSHNAPPNAARDLAAEIDERIDRILDGEALILRFTAYPRWSMRDIAEHYRYKSVEELGAEMRLMLKYVAGKQGKKQTYPQWKAVRKCRNAI